jgi:hypothetical protein
MTSIAPVVHPPAPSTPALPVGPVGAVAPVAFAAVQAEVPLPSSTPLPAQPPAPAAADNLDAAAMRPDQLAMARQLSYPRADAAALANSWRTMVRQYGSALVERELRARGGLLAPAQLLAAQEGRPQRPADPLTNSDPWRFTVHAGGAQEQELRVVGRPADPPGGRRRRARIGLRLELTLEDGTRVALQIEPMPGGVALELSAPGSEAMARLRRLEPVLEQAIERAGLSIKRRTYNETLAPPAGMHASLAAADATSVLTLPVFSAVAELALLLPACRIAAST